MEQQHELEQLKKEILGEIKTQGKKEGRKLPWGSLTITIILVSLMVISLVQAIQLANVYNKVKGGAIKPAAASSGSTTPLPASLQNLPNMVGGC